MSISMRELKRRVRAPILKRVDVQLLFLHIPKTGGMSLMSAFEQMFGRRHVFFAGDAGQTAWFRENFDKLKKHSVVAGHIPYRSLKDRIGAGNYYTVLREPVSRAKSIFKHWSTDERHPLHAETRDLSFSDHLEWLQEHPLNLKNVLQSTFVADGQSELKFYDTGSLQSLLDDVAKLYGLRPVIVTQQNARSFPVEVSESDRRKIEKLYAPDFELWERYKSEQL